MLMLEINVRAECVLVTVSVTAGLGHRNTIAFALQ